MSQTCHAEIMLGYVLANRVDRYVAMHTMQEGGHNHGGHEAGQNGYVDTANVYDGYQTPAPKQEGATLTDTLACVGGMLLPLLTQVGHAHAH